MGSFYVNSQNTENPHYGACLMADAPWPNAAQITTVSSKLLFVYFSS